MNRKRNLGAVFCTCVLAFLMACDGNEPPEPGPGLPEGSGDFVFSAYEPLKDKPIRVFFYIPSGANTQSPVVLVFHGADRNAADYRNAWIDKANAYKFMVFAPEFSEAFFPGGDAYNLGNVFQDGDNPSPATLNDEVEWTFSLVEPLFDHIKSLTRSQAAGYYLYGHSAGAQFVHRLLMFKPESRCKACIASAAGWYTLPDAGTDFPYGTGKSPAENFDLRQLYERELTLIVGTLDNDPNAPGLRHNSIVDQQGSNRLDRALYFYQFGQQNAATLGSGFLWQYRSIPGVGHDHVATSQVAADLLFK